MPLSTIALRFVTCGVITATLGLTAACGDSGTPSTTGGKAGGATTITVGITGATAPPTFLPLIAHKLGLDTKNGVDIKFVTLTPDVTAQTLSRGSVDILASPSVEAATLKGAPFKILAGAALSYWHFVASKGISDWSDLEGKKIGLPCGVGATCVAFINGVLDSHGVDPASVTFINGTAQGTYESVAAGSVDAALTTAPYTYALDDAHKTHELDISDAEPYLSTQFTAKSSYTEKNGDAIAHFVTAISQAEAKLTTLPISSDVLEVIDAFEKENGIDPATLDQDRFLTEFANDKTWQLVPTKSLITRDLGLIAAADPTVATAASKATFEDMVYQVPQFSGRYE